MKSEVWIGVDFDGTLAEYHGWNNGHLGEPIPRMVNRVKQWLAEGREVRIVTARVAPCVGDREIGFQTHLIAEWCKKHLGQHLEVTCYKDYNMIELWDDRSVQVIPNTGIRADGKDD